MTDEEREKLRAPFWCPICQIPLKNGPAGDDRTLYKWGCCRHCFIEFIEHREERWVSGWRPNEDDLKRLYEKMKY